MCDVRVYDDENTDELDLDNDEIRAFQRLREETEGEILVYFFYTGHGIVASGCASAINEYGKASHAFENFLRNIADMDNVSVVGFYDCCLRDRGNAGITTSLEPNMKFITVTRDSVTAIVDHKQCACEPW